MNRILPSLLAAFAFTACSATTDPHEHNDLEFITTVSLDIRALPDGTVETYTWEDLEADGNPIVDTVLLNVDTSYAVDVFFLNALEDPAEDISAEVANESDEHHVFFTGPGVSGPASDAADALTTHTYDDTDGNGYPLGLANTLSADAAGTSEFTVTLRHLPADGGAIKDDTMAATVASGGFSAIGGDTDVQVVFPLSVE